MIRINLHSYLISTSNSCDFAPTRGSESSALVASLFERSKRGPAFLNVEDVIVSKAFIAASENALCGAHQKGKVFKAHMFNIYVALIKEQLPRAMYPKRSANSIYNRFKGQVAPEVMRYMGIDETIDMGSGWSPDNHKAACLKTFKQRYGHLFDFTQCTFISRTRTSSHCLVPILRRHFVGINLWERRRRAEQKLMQNSLNPLCLKLL